jgi:hypothetical protein
MGRGVTVQLDKRRTILFDLNALSLIEERLDIKLKELPSLLGSARALRAMLWAGLVHEDEDLTEKDVGALVNGDNLMEIMEAVNDAVGEAFPEQEETENSPPTMNPPMNGIGGNSDPLPSAGSG